MSDVAKALNIEVGGVPFLLIHDKHFVGFSESITGATIEKQLVTCLQFDCQFTDEKVLQLIKSYLKANLQCQPEILLQDSQSSLQPYVSPANQATELEKKLNVQLLIIGEVNIKEFSLPLLTLVLALIDGFNPCAMWALLFLISLLLRLNDRKKIWLLGSIFILASAIVYFVFMTAWLNLFLFIGVVYWLRIVIGVVALFAGSYYLGDFWINRGGVCKVSSGVGKKQALTKLENLVETGNLWLSIIGVIGLSITVNMIEMVCSAGLPAVYTQLLALNDLATWQYYVYLAVYIAIFMLDDMIVFVVAMITLKSVNIENKYGQHSRLIGGLVIIIIGLLLLFYPQALFFG